MNSYLQEITDFLKGADSAFENNFKIFFPYGYLRTADDFRKSLSCIEDGTIKSNSAFSLILSDLYTWLICRTNIVGTLQEMIIKNEIVIMAAICETLLVLFTSKKLGYKKRIAKLKDEHKISPESGKGLNWLWEIRVGIHLYELTEKEYNKYSVLDFRKAKDIGTRLVQELNKVSK